MEWQRLTVVVALATEIREKQTVTDTPIAYARLTGIESDMSNVLNIVAAAMPWIEITSRAENGIKGRKILVKVEYVDGSEDIIETFGNTLVKTDGTKTETIKINHFCYDKDTECFIVNDHIDENDCMMIPREFVKSIRNIEV